MCTLCLALQIVRGDKKGTQCGQLNACYKLY
jgi:hypothetical protein